MTRERIQAASEAILYSALAGVLIYFLTPYFPTVSRLFQNKAVIVLSLSAASLAFLVYGIYFYSKRWTGHLRKAESIVVSALVFNFDEEKVLLAQEKARESSRPWLVPPGAHLESLKGRPEQAVIDEVKDEAGIDIEIDIPDSAGQGGFSVTPLALPVFVQSEHQQSELEGHKTHHNFYYVGRLLDETKSNGKYKWIRLKELGQQHVPREMIDVIRTVFASSKPAKQASP